MSFFCIPLYFFTFHSMKQQYILVFSLFQTWKSVIFIYLCCKINYNKV